MMITSHTVPLPHPVEIDGVTHESVTIVDSIEISLSTPVDDGGAPRDRLKIRRLTGDEWKQVRRSAHTNQKRGIAICQLATGLPRTAISQLEQIDIEAIFRAETSLREQFAALDPILSRV